VRGDALLECLSNLAAQRETLDRRMSGREISSLVKFGAMDSLIAQLQTTSSFLSQQLNALQSGLNSRN
jgi:flagellar hook-associated protein 2